MANKEINKSLTSNDLETILETNKKAIEIYLEVESQNEDIIKHLQKNEIDHKDIIKDLLEIDRHLFRLTIALSPLSLGTIIAIILIIKTYIR